MALPAAGLIFFEAPCRDCWKEDRRNFVAAITSFSDPILTILSLQFSLTFPIIIIHAEALTARWI